MNELRCHSAIRSYVLAVAGLNLLWEVAQLPLYTIWRTGSKPGTTPGVSNKVLPHHAPDEQRPTLKKQ